MRQQPSGRRPRGRSNRKHFVPHRSQTYDSHGPDVRVRGNAMQVYEKYVNLARDAFASGDRIAAEGFQQYAEHYYRIINDTTDPQRPASERPAGERPAGERGEAERGSPERASPERGGSENKSADGQPYPMDAEQPFVDGEALGSPSDGNGKASEAKPAGKAAGKTDGKADVEEPAKGADGADAAEAEAAEQPKPKARSRGRPRSRAKAGNGAAAKAEGDAASSAGEAGDS